MYTIASFSCSLFIVCFTASVIDAKTVFGMNSQPLHRKFLKQTSTGHFFNRNEYFETGNKENAVETPLKIGSFNVQTLSSKKFNKPNVMSVVEKVILRYDLILIMEVMLKDDYFIRKLLSVINGLAPNGIVYNMTQGSAHPDTRELCVFFYRTRKLKVFKAENYPDPSNQFYRKPFIVTFQAFTLRDMRQFVTVGHHVKPNTAVQEINALANVYDYIKTNYHLEDVLLMGDFNADCTYVKEQDWNNMALWTRLEFTWMIQTHVDTTTNHRSCALDRFVFAGRNMNDGVIMSSAQPFRFQEAYGLTIAEAREVSDHLPIEIQVRGKLSTDAERYLTSNICVSVSDNRTIAKMANLDAQAKAAGFIVTTIGSNAKIIQKNVPSLSMAMATLQVLHELFPKAMTQELQQGIIYKLSHDSLHDRSSYAELAKQEFSVIFILDQMNTVIVCTSTTIN